MAKNVWRDMRKSAVVGSSRLKIRRLSQMERSTTSSQHSSESKRAKLDTHEATARPTSPSSGPAGRGDDLAQLMAMGFEESAAAR